MRRLLWFVAGTLVFFAIATYPVATRLGFDHLRSFYAGGLVSLLTIAFSSGLTRWTVRGMGKESTWVFLLGPTVRLFVVLAAMLVVPRLVRLNFQAFGGWLVFFYLTILFVESGYLASEQVKRDRRG
ncbi:MAG: hypothetical protein HY720_27145 [Planctomycetes bacterium]|nr:hypothetical protein [Planctomycetota bacterium]